MVFEEWWAKQTANFDPSEIELMELAWVTWNAAHEIEREACAKLFDGSPNAEMFRQDIADVIRMRSN